MSPHPQGAGELGLKKKSPYGRQGQRHLPGVGQGAALPILGQLDPERVPGPELGTYHFRDLSLLDFLNKFHLDQLSSDISLWQAKMI